MESKNREQATETAGQEPLPGGSFRLLVQKLGYQAMMGLGLVENPLTNTQAVNLPQARMVIEDLEMLLEKTQGNLDEEESEHLTGILTQLSGKLKELS